MADGATDLGAAIAEAERDAVCKAGAVDASGGAASWLALVRAYCAKGKRHQAERVLRAFFMQHGSDGPLQEEGFVATVEAAARHQTELGQNVLFALLRDGARPSSAPLNAVLRAWFRDSRAERAERAEALLRRFLRQNARIVPDGEAWSIVIGCYAALGTAQAAQRGEALYGEMRQLAGAAPSPAVFLWLVVGFLAAGDGGKASAALSEAQQARCAIRSGDLERVLGMLLSARGKAAPAAIDVAGRAVELLVGASRAGAAVEAPGAACWNRILDALADANAPDALQRIEQVVGAASAAGVAARELDWTPAARACRLGGHAAETFEQVRDYAVANGAAGDPRFWHEVIACYHARSGLPAGEAEPSLGERCEGALVAMANMGMSPSARAIMQCIQCRVRQGDREGDARSIDRAAALLLECWMRYGRGNASDGAAFFDVLDRLLARGPEDAAARSEAFALCAAFLELDALGAAAAAAADAKALGARGLALEDVARRLCDAGEAATAASFALRFVAAGIEPRLKVVIAVAEALSDGGDASAWELLRAVRSAFGADARALRLPKEVAVKAVEAAQRGLRAAAGDAAAEAAMEAALAFYAEAFAGKASGSLAHRALSASYKQRLREAPRGTPEAARITAKMEELARASAASAAAAAPAGGAGGGAAPRDAAFDAVDAWASSGAPDAAEKALAALEEAQARGCAGEKSWSAVVKAFAARDGGAATALELLDRRAARGRAPHGSTFSLVCKALSRPARGDRAAAEACSRVALLAQASGANADAPERLEFCFVYALNAWARVGSADCWRSALETFRAMRAGGLAPSAMSLDALLRCCLAAPRPEALQEACDLLEAMHAQAAPVTHEQYRQLLNALARGEGSAESAGKVDALLVRIGDRRTAADVHMSVKAWVRAIGAGGADAWDVARRCDERVAMMVREGMETTAATWNLLCSAYALACAERPQLAEQADAVAARMAAEANVQPNAGTFATLCRAWDRAGRKLQQAPPGEERTAALRAAAERLDDALRRLARCEAAAAAAQGPRERGGAALRLQVPCNNAMRLWSVWGGAEAYARCTSLLDLLRECGVPPTARSFSTLARTAMALGKLEEAKEVLRMAERSGATPEAETYDSVIRAYANAGRDGTQTAGASEVLSEVIDIFRRMLERGVTPTCHIISELLRVAAQALREQEQSAQQRFQFARSVFETVRRAADALRIAEIDGRGFDAMRRSLANVLMSEKETEDILREFNVRALVNKDFDDDGGYDGSYGGGSSRKRGAAQGVASAEKRAFGSPHGADG